MSRILIDGYFLEKPYGFGRFIAELCRALGTADTAMRFVVATPDRVEVARLPHYPALSWHPVADANFIRWEQVMLPRLAHALRCDLIHCPYNTRPLFTGALPVVTTVHDTLFLEDNVPVGRTKDYIASRYSKFIFHAGTRRLGARGRNPVVAVSDTTRRSLQALGLEASTVYNTADGFIAACAPPTRPIAPLPYLFHRGGYAEHRNTGRVIEAFRSVRPRLGATVLKILGAPQGAARWHTQDDPAIEFLPRVSDQELATLYAGSAGVLATSLSEGFGLPIIESFGFGAPVVTSRIDPMMEVAGDAALLVDPTDVDAIGQAIVAIVTDAVLARSLVTRGRARMARFASAHVARQMMDIYRTALADATAPSP